MSKDMPYYDAGWEWPFDVEVDETYYVRGKLDGGCRVGALKFDEVVIYDENVDGGRDLTYAEYEHFHGPLVQARVFETVRSEVERVVERRKAQGGA
jgi:hypothetical protein